MIKCIIWHLLTPFAILCLATPSILYAQQFGRNDNQAVPFYNYHSTPPFVVGNGSGLVYDLGKYLTRKIVGEKIYVEDLPRKRLDIEMRAQNFRGAVLLVSPAWFGDPDMKTYNWTNPIFVEEDLIVSPVEHKVEYKSPISLKGKSIGIVLGYQYPMFDDLIAKGDISRWDTRDEKSGLAMLALHRLDTIVIARSALGYLLGEMKFEDKIFISDIPVNRYERRILVSKRNPLLKAKLDAVIAKMPNDPEWKGIMEKYRLGNLH